MRTKKFTLIELMIVVAIIAIIATIAIPQLIGARRNSNEKAAVGNLRTVMTDQETYKNDNEIYATLSQLASSGKIDLMENKAGYSYSDIITAPNGDFYANLASPTGWGVSGQKHYAITVAGKLRVDTTEATTLNANNVAEQATIDAIELFPEVN